MESDPTLRFSSRVADYIRYRPSYPAAVIQWLEHEFGLTPRSCLADIGSGTGMLSRLFAHLGCQVYGVEPNAPMRLGAERVLAGNANFHSVDGRAEATTLAGASVDFVTAAQAFHWFDPEPTRAEFRRILKPGGWVILIWNERLVTPGFLTEFEEMLLRLSSDYGQVDHRRIDTARLGQFFQHDEWRTAGFPNHQDLDWEGLKGRLLSASYVPLAGDPGHQEMLDELAASFAKYQEGGHVRLLYETKVYAGQLS